MSNQIPLYMAGKNVSAATIQGQTPNVSGVLSPGTSYDLHQLGVLDSFEYEGTFKLFEVSPVDGVVENYQGGKDTFTFTVGEIEAPDGTTVLFATWGSYNYARFEADVTAPGGSTPVKLVVIGIRETIRKGIVEEKNGVIATFKPCGIKAWYGTGTPAI